MVTPEKLREILNDRDFLAAYEKFVSQQMNTTHNLFKVTKKPCLNPENDKQTAEQIKRALKGDSEKGENILIGECSFYDIDSPDIGKNRYLICGIARCAELKRGSFLKSSKATPLLEVIISVAPEITFNTRTLGLPSLVGQSGDIPVKYRQNLPITLYLA